MKSKSLGIILLVAVVASAAWFFQDQLVEFFNPAPKESAPIVVSQPQDDKEDDAVSKRMPMPPRNPVAPPESVGVKAEPELKEIPFPETLEQADAYLNEILQQLIGNPKLLALVNLNYFIPKLVLFIDNLPEKSIPRLYLPITPLKPGFLTQGSGEIQAIDASNAARYTPYVNLVEAIPDGRLLQLYRGLYPLLQQAYRETSDPGSHFNDRFIQVLDDLLQTPEPSEPIKITKHISRFKYVDESLEARSAGQKILLRMGVENTRRIKQKLQQLRQGLVRKDW